MKPDDLPYIASQRMDFLGINYYFRKVCQSAAADPILPFQDFKPAGAPYTERKWQVWTEGRYDWLVRRKKDYGDPRKVAKDPAVIEAYLGEELPA